MGPRIWILIVIDVFFVVGLGVLLFLGGGNQTVPIIACVGLIAYVSWSIVRRRAKAKAPE
jgi:hypothetical protein